MNVIRATLSALAISAMLLTAAAAAETAKGETNVSIHYQWANAKDVQMETMANVTPAIKAAKTAATNPSIYYHWANARARK